ncbi:MAG: hypothetical protein IJK78_12135 [Bacteroidales bacterium]|nr:hypothetical protein [Bacteroidales bacterium]
MDYNIEDEGIESIVSYGSWNQGFFNKLCALVFALAPILQHYIGIIQNAGFTVLILISPILVLKFLAKISGNGINKECLVAILPLILFELYTVVVHGVVASRLFYVLFLILLFLSIASGCVNISYFIRYAVIVAIMATIAVLAEYVSHYVLHRDLDLKFLEYLVKDDTIWDRNAEAIEGLDVSAYFFRPSGFFLEPSHFFLYSFPLIGVCLLSPERNRKSMRAAIFISLGVILSTSGMGIACVIGLWLVYFVLKNNDFGIKGALARFFSARTILIGAVAIVILFVAYLFVPFFQSSVDRIFTNDDHSAIDGRVRLASSFAKSISGQAIYFGTPGITRGLEFNLSGFYATYFKWGIVGLFFTYWFYIQGIFKLKGAYFWISLIIVVISYYTAHTHGTFYMLYYILFLMSGYYDRSMEKYQFEIEPNQFESD